MKKINALTAATLIFTVTVFALLFAILIPDLFPQAENVFDRLYYEVKQHDKDCVLLTGTESAYADYDLGSFQHISIPDLNISLSIRGKSLNISFSFFVGPEKFNYHCVHYRYDIDEKKLYGEDSLDYLTEHFLSHYFKWHKDVNKKIKFSSDNLGKFTFTSQEHVSWDNY